jgi:hypothetical protein
MDFRVPHDDYYLYLVIFLGRGIVGRRATNRYCYYRYFDSMLFDHYAADCHSRKAAKKEITEANRFRFIVLPE